MAGLFIAWKLRNQSKGEYLASLRTQKGQHPHSEMGVGVFFQRLDPPINSFPMLMPMKLPSDYVVLTTSSRHTVGP